MIITKQIAPEDKKIFDSYYGYPDYSLYNFSNVYMWSDATKASWAEVDGMFCMFIRYRSDQPVMLCPMPKYAKDIFRVPDVVREVRHNMPEIAALQGIPTEVMSIIHDRFPLINTIDSSDQADYIYSADDLRLLQGKHFHGKRNHLNTFINSYNYTYTDINSTNLNILREAIDSLYSDNGSVDLEDEQVAIKRLLDSFEFLDLRACVISVGGRYVAYSIGEMMNNQCTLIHIEKADRDYNGSYAAVNNLFLINAFSSASFVNREEDMGIEGLRRAKMSYNPIKQNNISIINFNNKEEFFNVKCCNAEQMACSCRGVCK